MSRDLSIYQLNISKVTKKDYKKGSCPPSPSKNVFLQFFPKTLTMRSICLYSRVFAR